MGLCDISYPAAETNAGRISGIIQRKIKKYLFASQSQMSEAKGVSLFERYS